MKRKQIRYNFRGGEPKGVWRKTTRCRSCEETRKNLKSLRKKSFVDYPKVRVSTQLGKGGDERV